MLLNWAREGNALFATANAAGHRIHLLVERLPYQTACDWAVWRHGERHSAGRGEAANEALALLAAEIHLVTGLPLLPLRQREMAETPLVMSRRHVCEGLDRIECQRQLVTRLEQDGREKLAAKARDLLLQMTALQAVLESYLWLREHADSLADATSGLPVGG